MSGNSICILLLLLIWVFNGRKILYGFRHKISGEIYHHFGMGLFFSTVVIERFYAKSEMFWSLEIPWLRYIGFALFIPSAWFIFGSIYQLKVKGSGSDLSPEKMKAIVDKGVFGLVRHPMWLGFSIWSFALVLRFQSVFALALFLLSVVCFRIASFREDEYALQTFGDAYREYMQRVPMWNFVRKGQSV